MKPVYLKFKGINSFSEQTEIDFENLVKNGLFGIFGDTGSGKSTILDCINFALYGKVERSSDKLDIINYKSDSAEVKFEFEIVSEGKRNRYAAERSLRRKSGTHKAMLYENDVCIADNATSVTAAITRLLGVNADDFRKCIALPQGEFAQFVKSAASDRMRLIERLFSLSKYGLRLNEKLKIRENSAQLRYLEVKTKLNSFENISENKLKEYVNEISELEKKAKTFTENLKKTDIKINQLKILSEKSKELCEIETKLNRYEKDADKINALKNGIKVIPACKSVIECNEEIKKSENLLQHCEAEICALNEKQKELNRRLAEITSFKNNKSLDDEISDCLILSERYASCGGNIEKFNSLKDQLKLKREEYKEREIKSFDYKSKVKDIKKVLKCLQDNLSDVKDGDLDYLVNVAFRGAVLKEEYVDSMGYFTDLNGKIKLFEDGSALYKFISEELKTRIKTLKLKLDEVKEFSLVKAKDRIGSFKNSNSERENILKAINDKTLELKDAESALAECEKDLNHILKEGELLKNTSCELAAELNKIFGDINNYKQITADNLKKLNDLKKQKAYIFTESENLNACLRDISSKIASKRTEKENLVCLVDNLRKKYKMYLVESGFTSLDDCCKTVSAFSDVEDIQYTISEYETKIAALKSRKSELENTEGIREFSIDVLDNLISEKSHLDDEYTGIKEKIAVYNSEKSNIEEKLGEKNSLLKEFSECEKEVNLIEQLKVLTRNNRFMEFIANEYLYDISVLASKMLLKLTNGRYFLTYTDTFYIGDNFNNGNLRGVNTLSGGETFLVSLSLALALSQTICSSLKSIEFFFLDEGFGTLDSSLVDTVMDALEKLKSSNFTIGVISHVEELKHRIDYKIIVNKATETRGSTVNVSC